MCSPAPCSCGKITWSGCGEHIEYAKSQVPEGQWCDGNHDAAH